MAVITKFSEQKDRARSQTLKRRWTRNTKTSVKTGIGNEKSLPYGTSNDMIQTPVLDTVVLDRLTTESRTDGRGSFTIQRATFIWYIVVRYRNNAHYRVPNQGEVSQAWSPAFIR